MAMGAVSKNGRPSVCMDETDTLSYSTKDESIILVSLRSNKNLTRSTRERSTRVGKLKINSTNCSDYHSGTLLRAFDVLDDVECESPTEATSVFNLQTAISTTLESRGWQFDENEDEWVYHL